MSEKDIFLNGVWSILDELKKGSTETASYTEGLVRGVEIGLRINDGFENRFGKGRVEVEEADTRMYTAPLSVKPDLQTIQLPEQAPNLPLAKEPRFHRRHRVYDEEMKKNIVLEAYSTGFDMESVRVKYDILGKGTIQRWIEQYSKELGQDIEQYNKVVKCKRIK